MVKLKYSKHALHQKKTQLALYRKILPSLDLKRRQLILEEKKSQKILEHIQAEQSRLLSEGAKNFPMLANEEIEFRNLLVLQKVNVSEEVLVGVKVPSYLGIECYIQEYSLLIRPAWLDGVTAALKKLLECYFQIHVMQERVDCLSLAIKKVTQRVNLFEKVLIPETLCGIKKIQIVLGDVERDAVIRAKLFKKKRMS